MPPARFVAVRTDPDLPCQKYSLWVQKHGPSRENGLFWTGMQWNQAKDIVGCQKRTVTPLPLCGCLHNERSIGESHLLLTTQSFTHQVEMVLLVTSDNEQFQAEKEVVERSVLIKNMLEGNAPTPLFIVRLTPVVDVGENDQPIPLPNVSSSVLKKASCFGCCVNLVVPLVLICDCHRFSSTANITVESPCQVQKQIRIRTTPANGRQIYRNGTKGSSPWTRRCCLRSSSPPTTLILSPYCMLILGTCPFFFFLLNFVFQRCRVQNCGEHDQRQNT